MRRNGDTAMEAYRQNNDWAYIPDEYAARNTFINTDEEPDELPLYEDIKDRLPRPVFEGHDDYIACYDYAWKTAFSNIHKPGENTGFVSSFLDAAFNGNIFMWDCSFMMMFGKYADRIFKFQKTLDNFYSLQHRDGFICREIIEESGRDVFSRFDPSSTGPNILAWCEYMYYETVQDRERLEKVYAPLRAFHNWYRKNRTWPDGSYYSSGWGCGMDNVPRFKTKTDAANDPECQFSHGHMTWADICLQQILNCDCLIKMNGILGGKDDVSDLIEEKKSLTALVNDRLWDEKDGFYYDRLRDGTLCGVKHIGAYWALVADAVPEWRLEKFTAHLENPAEFGRVNAVPTLSADHPLYCPEGHYWRGSSWAPTTYMVLKGLEKQGCDDMAYRLGDRFLANVVKVFNDTGTVWENYQPDAVAPGVPAKPNFVGWTGLAPISVMFEFVFGIKPHVADNTVVWNVNRLERHGIENYPFGADNTLTLMCEKRSSADEEPQITVKSEKPVKVIVRWNGKEKTV